MTEKRGKRGLRTRGIKPFFSLLILKRYHKPYPLCHTRPQAAFAALVCTVAAALPRNLIPYVHLLGRSPR